VNVRSLTIALIVCAAVAGGCLETDSEPVSTTSWDDTKQAPDGSKVSDAPSPRISAGTFMASGRMLEQQNDYPGAIRQYDRALANDANLTEAHNRQGIAYQKLGMFAEAEAAYRKGVRSSPDSAMLHNNLGYCYLLQEKYEAAEGEFRDALVIAPNFDKARMNLGIVLARTERIADSVAEFSQIMPAEVAYYNVAVLCTETKNYVDARRALRRALKINPEYRRAQSHLNRISGLADARTPGGEVRTADEPDRAGEDAARTPQ